MKNKKIVILGGGENQLPLLIESKKLGYYIILCDFRSQNPGKHIADIHYLVNTLNYEEVLNVCIKEQPDGIITNSEPAIPIMTKVANKLGLIGNSESGIAAIMSKDKFRALQSKLGHYCPKHILVSSVEDLKEKISDYLGIGVNTLDDPAYSVVKGAAVALKKKELLKNVDYQMRSIKELQVE